MVGGAAIAASRLTHALNRHGVKAQLLVRDRQTDRVTTCQLPNRGLQALRQRWAFLWERCRVWFINRFRLRGLWAVDIACAGTDITRLPQFREADVIHLHWVNQGMLSLRQLQAILQSGKPVVWTMHDQWPYTAICHYARTCEHYLEVCHACPQLLYPRNSDISRRVFEKKQHVYACGSLTFVGPSQWICDFAHKSRLTRGHQILHIPNTYDANIFHPADNAEARRHHRLPQQGLLLLFACQKISDERKGLSLLLQALSSNTLQALQGQLSIVVVGQVRELSSAAIPFPIHALGYIRGDAEMAALYQAVDLFVTPSLEDNLPNTIMEAMACGTPCVGFRVGGIPEMIDHEDSGYVARYRDVEDLAQGIVYALDPQNHQRLSAAAARKAVRTWNEDTICRQYTELYNRVTSDGDTSTS